MRDMYQTKLNTIVRCICYRKRAMFMLQPTLILFLLQNFYFIEAVTWTGYLILLLLYNSCILNY